MLRLSVALAGASLVSALVASPGPTQSRPMATNLSTFGPAAQASMGADGPKYLVRALPDRLIMSCNTCAGAPIVDIKLGRQDDGTEGRVRSGQTTIAMLERNCKVRDHSCQMTGVSVGSAIGWRTAWQMGSSQANTVVLLKNGAMLTMRTVGYNQAAATQTMDLLLSGLAPSIIGP